MAKKSPLWQKQDKIDEIIALYETGDWTLIAIAEKFGVSHSLIASILNGNNTRKPSKPKKPGKKPNSMPKTQGKGWAWKNAVKIKEAYYSKGKTLNGLAAEYGTTRPTITAIVERGGLPVSHLEHRAWEIGRLSELGASIPTLAWIYETSEENIETLIEMKPERDPGNSRKPQPEKPKENPKVQKQPETPQKREVSYAVATKYGDEKQCEKCSASIREMSVNGNFAAFVEFSPSGYRKTHNCAGQRSKLYTLKPQRPVQGSVSGLV